LSDTKKWIVPTPLIAAHNVTAFESVESTLDYWLKHRALRNEGRGASRTYVVCEEKRVIGYYALAAGVVVNAIGVYWAYQLL